MLTCSWRASSLSESAGSKAPSITTPLLAPEVASCEVAGSMGARCASRADVRPLCAQVARGAARRREFVVSLWGVPMLVPSVRTQRVVPSNEESAGQGTFASTCGPNLVELRGLEPLTPWLGHKSAQCRRHRIMREQSAAENLLRRGRARQLPERS